MKRKFTFPTAYTVILIVLGLTYIIPAGKYAKLQYSLVNNVFIVEDPIGDIV